METPLKDAGKRRRVGTALIAGLGWGLALAVIEGLPLLLAGSPGPHLGARLLAVAYLAALYGVLCAIAAILLASVARIAAALARAAAARRARGSPAAGRPQGPSAGVAAVAGHWVLAVPVTAVLLAHRLNPTALGWVGIGVAAVGGGVVAGRLAGPSRLATGRVGRVPGGLVVALFVVAVGAVAGVALYRGLLRDRPAFNPPVTTETATPERPNVVLITAGGVRADRLGIYGGDPAVSPNIDALAERGTRFEQAIAPGSWTVPSLAALLTSLYPAELGIDCRPDRSCRASLDAGRVTLAELLRGAGYRTVGLAGSSWQSEAPGFQQGFDSFESVRAEEPFDVGPMQSRTLGRLLGCRRGSAACRLFGRGHALLFPSPLPAGYGGDEINGRVARFLDLHSNERFFVWVHYADALPPYDLEPAFRPLPEDPLANTEKRLKKLGYWELGDPFTIREELLPVDATGLAALYDGEVHRIDRLVGGLLGQLEARGLAGRTLVVLTADHGQEFLEHGSYTYGHTLYDEIVRVPLIAAGPGIAAGQSVVTPVSLIDVLPTLAEAAGAVLPPEVEGRSLVPALQGQPVAGRPVYSESLYRVPYELKALRRGDLKAILRVEDGRLELYDLRTDPAEQHDLAAARAVEAGEMEASLRAWLAHAAAVASDLPRAAPPAGLRDAAW